MPVLGIENTANITNVIWVFAAVAPWALVSLSERPRDTIARSFVALLAATSTSLCFLFLPPGDRLCSHTKDESSHDRGCRLTLGLGHPGCGRTAYQGCRVLYPSRASSMSTEPSAGSPTQRALHVFAHVPDREQGCFGVLVDPTQACWLLDRSCCVQRFLRS